MKVEEYDVKKAIDCSDALRAGLEQRRKIKMVRGAEYKIREIQGRLADYPEELVNVGKCAAGDQIACLGLHHCGSDDKAIWVRHIPALISFRLGLDLVGTLYALKDDGFTLSQIDQLQQFADGEIPELLKLAEIARLDAKSNWKGLKKQLAAGTGSTYDFAVGVNDFADAIVGLIEK